MDVESGFFRHLVRLYGCASAVLLVGFMRATYLATLDELVHMGYARVTIWRHMVRIEQAIKSYGGSLPEDFRVKYSVVHREKSVRMRGAKSV